MTRRRRKKQNKVDDEDRKQAEEILEFESGTFRTQRYVPTDSIRLKNRLGQILSGPIGAFMSSGAKAGVGLDTKVDEAAESIDFGDAVRQLFDNLGDEDPVDVFEHILMDTDIRQEGPNGVRWVPVDIDRDFAVNMMELYEVIIWVLRFNYEGMFMAAKKKIEQAMEAMQEDEADQKAKSKNGSNDESRKRSKSLELNGSSGGQS